MAAPWVSLDVIPEPARPDAVAAALAEASELRDRLRVAKQEEAEARAELERLDADDVAKTAQKIREGATPTAIPAGVEKQRRAVELKTRDSRALGVAAESAQSDLVAAMSEHGDEWVAAIEAGCSDARERALAALDALTTALDEIATATSAAAWVRSGQSDGRWDRPVRQMVDGSNAPSSRRLTANSEPLVREQILGFVAELVEPPPQPVTTPTPA
jgi:hypothetical protein